MMPAVVPVQVQARGKLHSVYIVLACLASYWGCVASWRTPTTIQLSSACTGSWHEQAAYRSILTYDTINRAAMAGLNIIVSSRLHTKWECLLLAYTCSPACGAARFTPCRWLTMCICLVVMALAGEWLCVRRELQDIPLSESACRTQQTTCKICRTCT